MKKQVNQNKNYMRGKRRYTESACLSIGKKVVGGTGYMGPISSSERCLLSIAEELEAFRVKDIKRLTGWNIRKVHNTLQSLKRKGLVVNPRRNRYALKSSIEQNAFRVATSIAVPSYMSFWSALSFYGFTEQQVSAIQLVSTKQEKRFEINGHRVETVTFRAKRFFGYTKENGFNIAEKEKAIIDSLFMPEKAGGLREVAKCMQNSWREIDKKKFAEYLIRFGNKSLCARAGYLIELLGLECGMEKLLKNKPKCFVKLNPRLRAVGKYNRKWGIIENQGAIAE